MTRFDPSTVLTVAELLLEEAADDSDVEWSSCADARLRSATSRSYYAAFLVLKTRLLEARRWPSFPSHEVHSKLRNAVGNVLGVEHPLVNDLKALRRERGDADYDLACGVSQARAETIVDRGGRALRRIAALTPQQVTDIAAELAALDRT